MIMATLSGYATKMVGSAGSMTFKRVAGRTIVSEKATVVTNPRTAAQQRHRMKWPNLIRMYAGISPLLRNAFENKPAGTSDYNTFVKVNFMASRVYLTKSEAAAKSIVAAPYIISDGSLSTIELTGVAGESVTNISLGSLSITSATTVGEFAKAVVNNNSGYDFGDQLSFIVVKQSVHPITGYPRCAFVGYRVELDKESEVCLLDLVSAEGFAVKQGKLACQLSSDFQGAYVWVHTRKVDGRTLVSTQVLTIKNDLYEQYTSEDAYQRAVNSYGGENNAFLTPTGSNSGGSTQSSGSSEPGSGSDSGSGSTGSETGSGGSGSDADIE